MTKKDEKRAKAVGFFTTVDLHKKVETEAKKLGRSVSSHLHMVVAERYAPKAKQA